MTVRKHLGKEMHVCQTACPPTLITSTIPYGPTQQADRTIPYGLSNWQVHKCPHYISVYPSYLCSEEVMEALTLSCVMHPSSSMSSEWRAPSRDKRWRLCMAERMASLHSRTFLRARSNSASGRSFVRLQGHISAFRCFILLPSQQDLQDIPRHLTLMHYD